MVMSAKNTNWHAPEIIFRPSQNMWPAVIQEPRVNKVDYLLMSFSYNMEDKTKSK